MVDLSVDPGFINFNFFFFGTGLWSEIPLYDVTRIVRTGLLAVNVQAESCLVGENLLGMIWLWRDTETMSIWIASKST